MDNYTGLVSQLRNPELRESNTFHPSGESDLNREILEDENVVVGEVSPTTVVVVETVAATIVFT